jgi:hypothetical protein
MPKNKRQRIAAAVALVSDWLREVDDSGTPTIRVDDAGRPTGETVHDPLDTRNMAIREMVIAYLEYQLRRTNPLKPVLPMASSMDSTRVIQLLETAAEAHNKFTTF